MEKLVRLIPGGVILVLIIIDCIRIIKRDPVRQEWVSLLYVIPFYITFWYVIKPLHFLSLKSLFVFLCTLGLSFIHFTVTVLNYWFVCMRWNRMLLFYIIAWTGIGGIFVFSLYLMFIL